MIRASKPATFLGLVLGSPGPPSPEDIRIRLSVRGLVQGVGFRPFVHRLAQRLGLVGFVTNSPAGARIEVEGPLASVEAFRQALPHELPAPAALHHVEATWLEPAHPADFRILPSETGGPRTALVLPDLATCSECRREIFDPANRRHRHPFANCTHCGPRFSIVEALPYDRARTVMRHFPMCPRCQAEYANPEDRRYHAQPIACPDCGPQLALWSSSGTPLACKDAALRAAVVDLRDGAIVALKAIGGFQFLVRADTPEAVHRLRHRKHREAKPFALMCPSLAWAARLARLSADEIRLIESPAAPIVLLARDRAPSTRNLIAPAVAGDSPWLGVLLPNSPLHHLLLADLDLPVVATSGNLADEPLCLDEHDALRRLAGIADRFLIHNRPIVRPVDDSVTRVVAGREQILRRARGYAPLPIALPIPDPSVPTILAVGAHFKNAVAIARPGEAFLSQHIGDLDNAETAAAFDRVVADLSRLLDTTPALVATDLHPDYLATQRALTYRLPVVPVPHHEAHAWSCLADNALEPPALAFAWDGTGLGTDGTIWGGEALVVSTHACTRRGALRPFPLPGGDAAARDTRRSALGLLHAADLDQDPEVRRRLLGLSSHEFSILTRLLEQGHLAPLTSSLGRLFDAVACLLGLSLRSRFEGEAALCVEAAAWRARHRNELSPTSPDTLLPIHENSGFATLDWQPLVKALLHPDAPGQADAWALGFHQALAASAVVLARLAGQHRVLLTGGCFQNCLLTELTIKALRESGFSPFWHQRIPPNDGGLAIGQAVATLRRHTLRSQP